MKKRSALLLALLPSLPTVAAAPPENLLETGLYADLASRTIAPAVVAYSPRFPLWTDGLEKSRWIQVPPGEGIDASISEHWEFPVGTKLWKEFAFSGRPVETRYMERTGDGWIFAAYAWSADGREARLAPARGVAGVAEITPGVRHAIPGRFECASCHQGQPQPVLGFSAVQLASGRTGPGAPDLVELSRRGLLVDLPARLLELPDSTRPEPRAVAAMGYLHGNCGHCHNQEGPLSSLGLNLRLEAEPTSRPPGAVISTVGRPATTSARAAAASHRIEPGDPERSQLLQRVATRDPLAQMPPLGTRLVDHRGVELLTAWIRVDLAEGSAAATSSAAQ